MSTLTIPHHQNKHTVMAILYGGVLMVWLTPEDATLVIVSLLGAGIALVLTSLLVLRFLGGRQLTPQQWIPGLVIFGMAVGFGAVWGTVGLMIFKNAWHSHAAPDFSGTVIVGIMGRLIPWTLAGGFVGGALALWRLSKAY